MANCSFDSKFGCSQEVALQIIEYAKRYGFRIKGISFHIGSGGEFDRKIAYQTALAYAKPILDQIEDPIVDIGGGLLYDTDLEDALGWTRDLPYRFIAEPGRFIAEPAYQLATQVIAVTDRGIFIDNGIYHELNVLHRDHWTFPKLSYMYDTNAKIIQKIDEFKTVHLFGPTCDSFDMIPSILFPNIHIEVGDWILLPNMGAYTSSAAVNFNGIMSAAS
jgi:ornithine decarboxylase